MRGWRVHRERDVYVNEWVRVAAADIEAPAGQRFDHHLIYLHPVAVALIVNADDAVLMVHRYRIATDQFGYELPGGIIEPGEDPADTAARETREETGWHPHRHPRSPTAARTTTRHPARPHRRIPMACRRAPRPAHRHRQRNRNRRMDTTRRRPALLERGQLHGTGTTVPLLHHITRHPTTLTNASNNTELDQRRYRHTP